MNQKSVIFTLFMMLLCTIPLQAQYNIEIGSYEFLSLDPPAGYVRNAYWSCDEGLTLTDKSEAGAVVKVTHWFSGAAYVNCSYTYEYLGTYDHNYHGGSATKTYRITCKGGTASISEANLELNPGESYSLSSSRSKSYGTPTWESTNTDVATVDKNGKVKAISTGVATIKYDPITAAPCFCEVRVRKIDAKTIKLEPDPLSVVIGKTKSLKPVYTPSGASATLIWSSENENIATVSSSGIIKGISQGKTTITATTEKGISAKASIEVVGAPTAVSLPSNIKISAGYYYSLTPSLTPSNSEAKYYWKSSDTSIATVSSAGKVYGKKNGVVTITVTTDNNLSASTTIQIVDAPAGVEKNNTDYRIKTITNLVKKIELKNNDNETK